MAHISRRAFLRVTFQASLLGLATACTGAPAVQSQSPVAQSTNATATSSAPAATATRPAAATSPTTGAAMTPTTGMATTPTASATTPTRTAAGGGPIKVGIVTSRSGALEYYGTMEVNGFNLGLEYATKGSKAINDRPVQVLVEDDAGKPDQGVQAARKLIEQEKVDILQGTASSAVALQIAQLAAQNKKIFMVAPAASDALTGINKYTFRTSRQTLQDALTGAKYAAGSLGKTFMNLAQDYQFGKDSASSWTTLLTQNNAQTMGDVFVPLDAKDFTPYLQQILQRKPDFVVVSWAGATGAQLWQEMNNQGVLDAVKVMTGLPETPSIKAFGDAGTKMYFMSVYYYTFPKNEVNDWLVKQYQAQFKDNPDIFTQDAFAAAQALVAAITKTGTTDADALIPALEGLSVDGPKGKYTLRKEDHACLQPMYIAKLNKQGDNMVAELIEEKAPDAVAPPVVQMKG